MLHIENLSYAYPGNPTPVVSSLQMDIPSGAVYGLLGANGTGKSTLLYLISGLLKPLDGEVLLNDVNTFLRLPGTLADIFLVPEEFEVPAIPLRDFISLNAPFYPNFSAEQLNQYLEHFRLSPDIHLGQLSMGQRKKAFIAFALACNTRLLLMDEPTNGLDIPGKAEFRRALVSAMTDTRTAVISTHQVRDLDRVLDHVVMIDHSRTLINCSMARIQERLSFGLSAQAQPLSSTMLYCESVPGGYATVELNGPDPATVTDVNLESLFELALTNPETITRLLNDHSNEH